MKRYKPYEFRREDAYNFANEQRIRVFQKGDELTFDTCPYCRGSSNSGKDKKTFSINLKSGMFKCFRDSCGVHGNMITLSKDFNFSLGTEIDEYYQPKKKFKKLSTPKEPIKPKEPALKFLEMRCISKLVAEKYQITTQTNRDNILVFPFYDENGLLQFVKYRKTDFVKEKDSAKEWCESNCKPILFGMKQCDLNNKTLVVTEGQMDTLAVATAYDGNINVVSVPTGTKGYTWVSYCWNWLCKFNEIIIFGDYEKGHITLLDDFNSRFRFAKIKHVKESDYKDCKDANEILMKYGKEQVIQCIKNSISIPVKAVIDLADVPDVDIYSLEKLKTGINDIDRLLYGGLPFGGLVLISGKRGEGKSTLTSQIMLNALFQDYKCFAYSGEISAFLFKAWTAFQVAGRNNIFEYRNIWGDLNYKIYADKNNLITEWFRTKCYLYDNTYIEDEESESLANICENMIIRNGVRVIFLDNLMTAIDLEVINGNDKYEKQSQFVKKLARIAIKYNVLIILVAHKRKNGHSTDENDEISGSADISNLASVTIAYEKDSELDESQRLCKISKNRLFGKVNNEGYVLNFDEKSRRIYGSGDDLDFNFGFEADKNGFLDISKLEITPFDMGD